MSYTSLAKPGELWYVPRWHMMGALTVWQEFEQENVRVNVCFTRAPVLLVSPYDDKNWWAITEAGFLIIDEIDMRSCGYVNAKHFDQARMRET